MGLRSNRSLEEQLQAIESRITFVLNASRDVEKTDKDRESFQRFVDHWLTRWLQVHDLMVVTELDRMMKRSSRDGS